MHLSGLLLGALALGGLGCTAGGSGDDTTLATASTPVIDQVTMPADVDCTDGDGDGAEVDASWSTTGAAWVSVAVDGSGIYGELPADGEVRLPFDCSSAHTFTVVALADDGQSAARVLTVTPSVSS